ncbi:MAG: Gfo/Idh/MocA family oxidoreductase [Verrucomicrobiales bacterium]|nr:Gfo/Idh/MocA family oxidoreductase [Verrucomicrobiales bacterium]
MLFDHPVSTSRRSFLATSTASLIWGAVPILAQKSGKKYRVALIGSGWWGMNLLMEALRSGRAQCVALCDVFEDALDFGADDVEAESGDKPAKFKDYREMLEQVKPEICIIATPDHWHALQTIACVKAGAHVLVEKPTGHTIGESQAMVRAARAAGTKVQVGLHRRIGPHHVEAMKFLKSGEVGKVGAVRCFAHSRGGKEEPKPNAQPPKGMDWEQWCGPAPLRPFNAKIHPGGWRNFLDYANGTMGDWGVHWLDQVLWWSGQKGPKKVFCAGGRPIFGASVLNEKEQTTDSPDHQIATFEFDDFTATWEHRKFAENHAEKHKIGCYFYGEKGTLHIGWRDGWTFYPVGKEATVGAHGDHQLQDPDGHNIALLWENFVEAIEGRAELVADIESAHRSSCLPMLGMLSYKLGRSVAWDAEAETIPDDAEAVKLMRRDYRAGWEYPV